MPDPADLLDLLARLVPGGAKTLRPLGEGWDNHAYETDTGLVVRVAKEGGVDRDAALLTAVSALLAEAGCPVAVPTPVAAEGDVLVYRKVPGEPLLHLPTSAAVRPGPGFAAPLGAFLTALHAAPVADWEELAGVDDAPLPDWLSGTADYYRAARSAVPAEHRAAIESFLDELLPEPAAALVFSHNDLGAEHLMVDAAGTLVGVIDWTDAAVADPAYEFGRLYRDLGPGLHAEVFEHYKGPYAEEDFPRALFYARCALIEDIAYGLENDRPEYVHAALANIGHTFP